MPEMPPMLEELEPPAALVVEDVPPAPESARPPIPRPPRIYLRNEWEARPPTSRAVVLDRVPDKLIVHHTATPNRGETSLEAAFRLSRAIQRYHMRHNGWDDIGEQFTISRGGHVMEGRNHTMRAIRRWRHVVGAQTAEHNRHTLGIETEGTYMDDLPPQRAMDALTRLLTWLCWHYELEPSVAIIGHRDLNATSCPGDRLYQHLPALREEVARRLDRGYGAHYSRGYRLAVPHWGPLPGPAHWHDHGPALGPHEGIR
ncbi:peptidoglycan recognition protein family protein [Acrocarpospora phusangensis]|nr:peptidoglycan recognition family protein [Acrocarpospora phusangensis]